MHVKQFRVRFNDPHWVSPEFKRLIHRSQHAIHHGDNECFKHLCNTVNHSNYYATKVNHLKQTKSSEWWSAAKSIILMVSGRALPPLLQCYITGYRTDGTGALTRIILFDYTKAFDVIDHNILLC